MLVAGVDSSTQSCKVVIRDAESGALIRTGAAAHPDGTEVDPAAWITALDSAVEAAGGLADVGAVAVGAQQHGMVCLDEDGAVVRPALLWNDLRSSQAAADLVAELGPQAWVDAVGTVPVASFTVTKLRWLAEHEPQSVSRTAAVCLPHDYLSWYLAGSPGLQAIRTDRGDASGTGYWSPSAEGYRLDLLERALGKQVAVPTVLGPSEAGGYTKGGAVLGPGTGDNAAAALGLGAGPGDVVVSIGTSGVVSAVSEVPAAGDVTGAVAGFADATGRFLPLVCTINAARILSSAARMLGVDLDELSRLALKAPAGADGLVLVPYLEGERTPDKPSATGSLHGLTLATMSPAHMARAAVEGLLCGLADGLDALVAQGARVDRVFLIGGGAKSPAVRAIAPAVLGRPVVVPSASEYVADGAARQAAWTLSGAGAPPEWAATSGELFEADEVPAVRLRYAEARELTLDQIAR
ncbi:MAG: xylulokinase [Frankiales bacterium]|jgi:xylulokinase|nr:xylulokinase [Frankiales bacterium]